MAIVFLPPPASDRVGEGHALAGREAPSENRDPIPGLHWNRHSAELFPRGGRQCEEVGQEPLHRVVSFIPGHCVKLSEDDAGIWIDRSSAVGDLHMVPGECADRHVLPPGHGEGCKELPRIPESRHCRRRERLLDVIADNMLGLNLAEKVDLGMMVVEPAEKPSEGEEYPFDR